MELMLYPGIPLETGTFNVVIADERLLVAALNGDPGLARFMFLYVCGNYSRVLPAIGTTSANFDVRRAFTAHQLLTIIREAYHTIVLVEHDPGVYDGAADLVGTVAKALQETAREAVVILYASRQDGRLNRLMRSADRVFCFAEPPYASRAVPGRRAAIAVQAGGAQRMLEGV